MHGNVTPWLSVFTVLISVDGPWMARHTVDMQRGSAPEFSGEMIGWALSGFSASGQKYHVFELNTCATTSGRGI